MQFDSCDEENFMILDDGLSFFGGQSIELCRAFEHNNALGFSLPALCKYPSKSLDDRLSFNAENSCDQTVDMSIVTKEAYLEPIHPNYDDLDSLGGEWWDFREKSTDQNLQVKVMDRFLDDSNSASSELSEPKNQLIESFVKVEETKRVGCRCGMTKCLRLHCRCFRDLEYCAKNCKCTSCFNNEEHEEVREFVIHKTREINKNAFTSKVVYMEHQEKGTINSNGCTCKTGCQRNYCECFKNSSGCSPLCRCSDCKNTTFSLPEGNVKRMIKGPSRKKNKIVIKDLNNFVPPEAAIPSHSLNLGKRCEHSTDCSLPEQTKSHEVSGNVVIAYQVYKRVKPNKRIQKVDTF